MKKRNNWCYECGDWIVIRSISDKADGEATMSYGKFENH